MKTNKLKLNKLLKLYTLLTMTMTTIFQFLCPGVEWNWAGPMSGFGGKGPLVSALETLETKVPSSQTSDVTS